MPIAEQRLAQVNLSPQARAVDTFVRPAEPREGLGSQLARALSTIEPGVRAYVQQRQEKVDKELKARADKTAFTDGVTEVKAIQAGTLYPQESKAFMALYRHQKGQMLSEQWRGEAEVAFNDAGLQNSTDPKQFDGFFHDFIKERLDGVEDSDVLQGALGGVEQLSNNLSLQNGALVAKNLQRQYTSDSIGQLSSVIDNEMTGALTEDRAFSIDTVMKSINASNAKANFLKLDATEFRKGLTDMVIDKAVRDADPSVLAVLDQKFDNGVPVSDGYWKVKRDETLKQIDARKVQIDSQLYEIAERKRKTDLAHGQSQILVALAKNPYAQLSADQLAQFEAYAPGLGEAALTMRNKLVESHQKVSTASTLSAMAPFLKDPGDLSKLVDAVNAGSVDPSTLRFAMGAFARTAQLGNGDAVEGWGFVKRHPAVAPYSKRFENAAMDPVLGKMFSAAPQDVADAEAEFNTDLVEFFTNNPKASMKEVRQHSNEVFRSITDRLQQSTSAADKPTPSAAAAAPKPAAQKPAAAPEAAQNPYDAFTEDQ